MWKKLDMYKLFKFSSLTGSRISASFSAVSSHPASSSPVSRITHTSTSSTRSKVITQSLKRNRYDCYVCLFTCNKGSFIISALFKFISLTPCSTSSASFLAVSPHPASLCPVPRITSSSTSSTIPSVITALSCRSFKRK